MTTDEKLADISYKVDDILSNLCLDNDMGPLVLSSIVLARLTLLNDYAGSGPDFRQLVETVSDTPVTTLPDDILPKVH